MNLVMALGVLWQRRQLIRRERMSQEELERYQEAQWAALREHAYQNSPFYQKFHQGLEKVPLSDLPVLTKQTLMENFDELVTDQSIRLKDVKAYLEGGGNLFQGRYRIASTSGTTGLRGIFVYGRREWNTVMASFDRASRWAGLQPGLFKRMRTAVVASRTPWHASFLVSSTAESFWVPSLALDAMEPLPEITQKLNRFQPHCLAGFSGMMGTLALEQSAGRLQIHPQAVLCSAEVLTGEARDHIRKAWGIESFDTYAATETGGMASECGLHHGLHFYEDLVIAEAVDSAYQPVPPGQYGTKLLVTVLFSRTLPLIRYEMGDSVMFSKESHPCGMPFRLVEKVQGRQEDILWMKTPSGKTKPVHPNVFHALFEPLELADWQVIQRPEGLKVKVAPCGPSFNPEKLRSTLMESLKRQGIQTAAIEVELVETLEKGPLGKGRLIIGLGAEKVRKDDLP